MSPGAQDAPGRAGLWLAAGLLVALAVASYLPVVQAGFVWDDDASVTRNPFVLQADGLRRSWLTTQPADYWPLTATTFWIEWRLWGADPLGYHLDNLALHVAEVLLLWGVLRRLRVPGAWLGALLFAVHPVNVESVAWIAQRKNLLGMLFWLMAVGAFLKAEPFQPNSPSGGRGGPQESGRAKAQTPGKPPPGPLSFGRSRRPDPGDEALYDPAAPLSLRTDSRWYAVSLGLFVLAMLSKGSVAVLPIVLVGIVAWRRKLQWGDARWAVPFFAVAGGLTVVDVWFQGHHLAGGEVIRSATPLQRGLGAGAVVWFYLFKALWPARLIFFYPMWRIDPGSLRWWVPLAAALGVTAWLAARSRLRPVLAAWLYFGAALLPVMGFTDVYFMKFSLVADHYQHLALIGVVALAGAGWAWWRRRSRAADFAAAAAVCACAVLTWRQCLAYRNAETLFRETLRRNPDSWQAHENLGVILGDEKRLPEATAEIQEALRLNPGFADLHSNLGVLLVEQGRPADGAAQYAEALRLDPGAFLVRLNLGSLLLYLGRAEEARAQLAAAARLKPEFPEAHGLLGQALARLGRPAEAAAELRTALSLKPDYPEARRALDSLPTGP